MEGLYQTPPIMYPVNNYHSTSPSHRPNDIYDYRRHSYSTNIHDTILSGPTIPTPPHGWYPMPDSFANSPSPPPPSASSVPPPPLSGYPFYGMNETTLPPPPFAFSRPRLTTNIWEDEGTLCYQVDAKGICVARRHDNDMINGTKLLNVVGMSRGKRDGILKNEKGRVVVKVGAMHLKGVWITFHRAKELSTKFKVMDLLYPLFEDDPTLHILGHAEKISNNSSHYADRPQQKQQASSVNPTSSFHPKMDTNFSLHHGEPSKHVYNEPNSEGGYRHVSDTEAYLLNGPGHHSHSHHHHNHHSHNHYNHHPFSHTNRSSFSSMSSHHSHMYALQHETDDTSKDSSATTPNSYMENPHSFFVPVTNDEHNSFFSNKLPDISTAINNDTTDPFTAGPTTPSSWFSPEPLYNQKSETEDAFEKERRRSSSCSLNSLGSERKQSATSCRSRKLASKKLKGKTSKM